jgi:hypothetical protein
MQMESKERAIELSQQMKNDEIYAKNCQTDVLLIDILVTELLQFCTVTELSKLIRDYAGSPIVVVSVSDSIFTIPPSFGQLKPAKVTVSGHKIAYVEAHNGLWLPTRWSDFEYSQSGTIATLADRRWKNVRGREPLDPNTVIDIELPITRLTSEQLFSQPTIWILTSHRKPSKPSIIS